jgi:hypothetical protein
VVCPGTPAIGVLAGDISTRAVSHTLHPNGADRIGTRRMRLSMGTLEGRSVSRLSLSTISVVPGGVTIRNTRTCAPLRGDPLGSRSMSVNGHHVYPVGVPSRRQPELLNSCHANNYEPTNGRRLTRLAVSHIIEGQAEFLLLSAFTSRPAAEVARPGPCRKKAETAV